MAQSTDISSLNVCKFLFKNLHTFNELVSASLDFKRSNDVDDNDNVKKTIALISKPTTSHVHRTFFCTYLSPFLHDYDMKMPNFVFYGRRKQATTKFYFSF